MFWGKTVMHFWMLLLLYLVWPAFSDNIDLNVKERIDEYLSVFGRKKPSLGIPLRGGAKEMVALSDPLHQHHQQEVPHAEENAYFILPPRQPRIYARAPTAVAVTQVRAIFKNQENGTNSSTCSTKYFIESDTRETPHFSVDECEGLVLTAKYVEKEMGDSYRVRVRAEYNNLAAWKEFVVYVTSYNKKKPKFTTNYSSMEVLETVQEGSLLTTLKGADEDIDAYNKEVFFFIQRPNMADKDPWLYATSFPLNFSSTTGEIRVAGDLRKVSSPLEYLIGVADGGSPQRDNITTMKLHIRKMSAPSNVVTSKVTRSSIEVCWSSPVYGEPDGYLLTLIQAPRRIRTINITADELPKLAVPETDLYTKERTYCYFFENLRPFAKYRLNIRAWNGEGYSMLHQPPLTIFTRNQDCKKSLCGNGVCQEMNSEPGYYCTCADGYYGKHCEFSDTCRDGNCDIECENTTKLCMCSPSFLGGSCSLSDRCLSHPSCYTGNGCSSESFLCYCNTTFGTEANNCSSTSILGLKHKGIVQCPESISSHSEGTFIWPKTLEGGTIVLPCPYGFKESYRSTRSAEEEVVDPEMTAPMYYHARSTREETTEKYPQSFSRKHLQGATRKCQKRSNDEAIWLDANVAACQSFFSTTVLSTEEMGSTTVLPSSEKVKNIGIEKSVKIIIEIADDAQRNPKTAQKMVDMINNILNVQEVSFRDDESQKNSSEIILSTINDYTANVQLNPGENVTLKTENLVVEARLLRKKDIQEEIIFKPLDEIDKVNKFDDGASIKYDVKTDQTQSKKESLSLKIPMETLKLITEENVRFEFVSYKDDRIFQSSDGSKPLNMPVISATVGQKKLSNLGIPISYTIPIANVRLEKYKPKCVFWNETEKRWNKNGLKVSIALEGGIVCESNHLTAFSVLLDPAAEAIGGTHGVLLSLITYIGIILSTASLIATIATYALFRNLNRDRSGTIVMNLSLALLFLNLGFTGAASVDPESKVCIPFGAFLHYAVAASFSWMLIEALNMHQLLVTVFPSVETHFMLKRVLAGWGVPLCLVAAALIWNKNVYIHDTHDFCVISPTNYPSVYYVTYLTPICIALALNTVVFVLVTKVLCKQRPGANKYKESPEKISHKKSSVTLAQIRGAVTVVALLGVTWIAGVLAVGSLRVILQYIFCATTPLQGFIIFFVRVIQSAEARAAWHSFITTGSRSKRHKHQHLSSVRTHSSTQNTSSLNTQSTGMTPPKSAFASAMKMARRLSLVTSQSNGLNSSFFNGRGKGIYSSWSNNSKKARKSSSPPVPAFEATIDPANTSDKMYKRLNSAPSAGTACCTDGLLDGDKSPTGDCSPSTITTDVIPFEKRTPSSKDYKRDRKQTIPLMKKESSDGNSDNENIRLGGNEGHVIPMREYLSEIECSQHEDPSSNTVRNYSLPTQKSILSPSVLLFSRTKSELEISSTEKNDETASSSRRSFSNDDLHLIDPKIMMNKHEFTFEDSKI